jgi:hypothetical protein
MKAKLFILFLFFILIAGAVNALHVDENVTFSPSQSNVTYVSPFGGFNATGINVNATCLVITGGVYNGTYCYNWHNPINVYLNAPILYDLIAPDAYSNQVTTVSINISKATGIVSVVPSFYYNGTLIPSYLAGDYPSYLIDSSVFPAPTVAAQTILNYTWALVITYNDSYIGVINISGNQTIRTFDMDDCSLYGDETLRLNIFDEESPATPLDAKVEFNAEFWINNPLSVQNYSVELTGNSTYGICINWTGQPLRADIYMKYTTDNGFTHRYFIVNGVLTNVTTNVSMFNFNKTAGISDLKGTIRYADTYRYFENVITTLQRWYPAENVWRNVQMDESGDFGLIFFNIKEENTDYRFLFRDRANNLLDETERLKFVCDAGICDLTFLLDEYSLAKPASNLIITHDYNNVTGNISVNWNDATGLTTNVMINVTKETPTGTLTICGQEFAAAPSGTYQCDVSAFVGTVRLFITAAASPYSPKLTHWYEITGQNFVTYLGITESAIWSFIIMLVIITFGIISPATLVLTPLIGLILLFYLGIAPGVGLTVIIIAAAFGLAIGLKVRR